MSNRRYLIVASGYNAGNLAQKCYESLTRLHGDHDWSAVMISDGSTDNVTNNILASIAHDRVDKLIFLNNIGAAHRRHHAIHGAGLNDHDVVIFLGLDDELLPNALNLIDAQYESGKWMTYGNWIDQHGKGLPKDFPLHFEQQTHNTNSYRQVTYRSTAPNTFLFGLYKHIPEERLQWNGKWIDSTTESEVMFSCLEMSGPEKQGVIHEPIYLYNRNLPNGTIARLTKEYKYKILADIVRREPMKRIVEWE